MSIETQFATHKHNGIDGTVPIKQSINVDFSLPGTLSATAGNYGIIFIARQNCVVVDAYEVHTTAGSDAGTVSLQLERLQGTEALNAGDELLTTAWNLKSTANTPVRGILSKDNRVVSLKIGDRLALKDSGTLTNLQGVCVSITIQQTYA